MRKEPPQMLWRQMPSGSPLFPSPFPRPICHLFQAKRVLTRPIHPLLPIPWEYYLHPLAVQDLASPRRKEMLEELSRDRRVPSGTSRVERPSQCRGQSRAPRAGRDGAGMGTPAKPPLWAQQGLCSIKQGSCQPLHWSCQASEGADGKPALAES